MTEASGAPSRPAADFTFHVIFMPGTVRYLKYAARSLVSHSACRFRLVANGLPPEEVEELAAFAGTHERLECYVCPNVEPLEHGVILTLLAARWQGEHFAFLDSDIFATGPFEAELKRHLGETDIFSSCSSPAWEPGLRAEGFMGRSTHTPTGAPLAATFFSVYPNALVQRVMRETGVGFERCFRPDMATPAGAKAARALGWTGQVCDTAKMLCMTAQALYGARVRHAELDGLVHLGGVSWWLLVGAAMLGDEERSRPFILSEAELSGPDALYAQGLASDQPAMRAKAEDAHRVAWRTAAGRYFASHLQWRLGEGPEPGLAVEDEALRARLTATRQTIDDAIAADPAPQS